MSNVLPFFRARGSSARRAAAPTGEVADILLFTGIRYERHVCSGRSETVPDDRGRDDPVNTRRRKTRRRA